GFTLEWTSILDSRTVYNCWRDSYRTRSHRLDWTLGDYFCFEPDSRPQDRIAGAGLQREDFHSYVQDREEAKWSGDSAPNAARDVQQHDGRRPQGHLGVSDDDKTRGEPSSG